MIQAHSLADSRAPDGGAPHAAAPGSEKRRVSPRGGLSLFLLVLFILSDRIIA